MNELRIGDIIRGELKDLMNVHERKLREAIQRAARRIASEADAERRNAARTASTVGYSITRGRPRL